MALPLVVAGALAFIARHWGKIATTAATLNEMHSWAKSEYSEARRHANTALGAAYDCPPGDETKRRYLDAYTAAYITRHLDIPLPKKVLGVPTPAIFDSIPIREPLPVKSIAQAIIRVGTWKVPNEVHNAAIDRALRGDEPPEIAKAAAGEHECDSGGGGGDGGGAGGISGAVNENYNEGQQSDPMVLDLDGDGKISTFGLNGFLSRLFDHNGDGIRTANGGADSNDGVLVRDLNGNGKIDNGGELFGDNTIKQDGTKAKHGFDALQDLDSNNDGVLDANDANFDDLQIWRDLNSDGISQANELQPLSYYQITSINLNALAQQPRFR